MNTISKFSMIFLAAGMAVISTDAQERGRGKSGRTPQRLSQEELQKALVQRIGQALERSGRDSRRAPQSRTPQRSSGDDLRKAWEERIKKAFGEGKTSKEDARNRPPNVTGEDLENAAIEIEKAIAEIKKAFGEGKTSKEDARNRPCSSRHRNRFHL